MVRWRRKKKGGGVFVNELKRPSFATEGKTDNQSVVEDEKGAQKSGLNDLAR